ncbi:MAG TPA: hypothetical protein VKB86_21850 [Pyrinomonadaceae bacterium]|nr:hypothetical protein [Pyrinomonadaceae bacterium]
MHITEIRRNSKAEAESFLAGLEFCDDSSNASIGVRRDPGRADIWLAVVVNFDARPENDLDEELSASESHPIEFYLEKYGDTERFDPSF